jgi:hypothetical protein
LMGFMRFTKQVMRWGLGRFLSIVVSGDAVSLIMSSFLFIVFSVSEMGF